MDAAIREVIRYLSDDSSIIGNYPELFPQTFSAYLQTETDLEKLKAIQRQLADHILELQGICSKHLLGKGKGGLCNLCLKKFLQDAHEVLRRDHGRR